MEYKHQYRLFGLLLTAIAVLAVLCLLLGLTLGIVKLAYAGRDGTQEKESEHYTDTQTENRPTSTTPRDVMLLPSDDAGMAYIDQMIFFGESTTAHLRSRGVLTGGTETKQVWSDSSGTRMLSAQTVYQVFDYPKTGEKMTIAQACAAEQPAYLVLSFGQNGLVNFASDKNSYVNNYKKLIDAVRAASPQTKIILQTVYPVRAQGNYSVDVPTLNQYINTLNGWLPEIASAYDNVCVADTASVLTDVDGVLAQSFDQGDGQHLTVAAYQAILDYLRTHAWQTPEL